jgi:PAS domain S-box-containing protein
VLATFICGAVERLSRDGGLGNPLWRHGVSAVNQVTDTPGRYELLVQSVTDYAIYMLDTDGIVSSWNAGAERFKGYKPDEIIGQHFSKFYTEEDLQKRIPEIGLRTAREDGRFEAEGWRLRKDGTRFWANVVIDAIRDHSGELVGFAKITRDLTERRLAEEQLRRSEERFRFLLQSVTDYAIYMLDTDGQVTSWNAGAERFKGYTADEIIGQNFSRFYSAEDQAAGIPTKALQTALTEGRFEAEGWRYRKDGTKFWANVVIDPVRNDHGLHIGYAKITRDLTERRRSQLALEEAQQAFFQSQKMEAIGQLTGGVAHDFNNLLAAIIGSADLARRRLAKGADISRFLNNIMEAAERGASLTQRMLAFARKQELELQAISLPALMVGMADLLQRTIGPGILIDTRFPLVLKPVQADTAQLELAIINLAVNARDAMPNGGKIIFAARHEHVQTDNGLKPGDYICLSVADEGHGMDEETLARAVDPFFTTKGLGKGTGLGLSMVAGTVQQCGGKLVVRSIKNEGTTVEIWLPVATPDRASSIMAVSVDRPEAVQHPLTILTVDDDEIVLTTTIAMLDDMGHTAIRALSGQDALLLLGEHQFDLLITDFAMPVMTGADLIIAVQAKWPQMPVIMVSGYAEMPEGYAMSIYRLAKPFRPDQLASAITECTSAGI